MKKIFTLFTLLLVTLSGFAQTTDTKSYDDLMRQSRRARTTSIIMVSTGPVIAAGGIGTLIYGLVGKDGGITNGPYVPDDKSYNTEIIVGAAGALVGIGLALTSIHFSKKANDFKREARKAKLKTSTERIFIPGLQNGFANNRSRQFKLSLIIPIGN